MRAVAEPVGLVAGLDDVAVVGQAVQQGCGDLCIAEPPNRNFRQLAL